MCGILGLIGYDQSFLFKSLAKIKHRGPDHSGHYAINKFNGWLGHVRLSIIDLDPRSNQPFISACGRYNLVFNGEIYNFLILKDKLLALGYQFKTTSDTEVLLYWLIRHGISGLTELEGMFAFGFYDKLSDKLLLARDHLGEKPLYYSFIKDQGASKFAFASEIKALVDLPGINKSLNKAAVADYFRFLYTAAPHTLYQGINELPPGHYLELDLNDLRPTAAKAYYVLDQHVIFNDSSDFAVASAGFVDTFAQSVKQRMLADVDIGIFLSGGIDSNAILALALQQVDTSKLNTYTLQYNSQDNEGQLAQQVAQQYGLANQLIDFSAMPFMASLDRVVGLFDQPFGNSTAIVADMIAEAAAKTNKVCLVGDGGDEVLVGYPRYQALRYHQRFSKLPRALRQLLSSGAQLVPERGKYALKIRRGKTFFKGINKPLSECFLDWSTYLDTSSLQQALGIEDVGTEFYHQLLDTFERYQADPMRAATLVDMQSFVPYNLMQSADRTSMAHSLELRCPFLATPLVHYCLGLSSSVRYQRGKTKPLLTIPFANTLPDYILQQPKRPFNPPLRAMLYTNIALLEAYLLAADSQLSQIMTKSFIQQQLNNFSSRTQDNSTLLWGMVTFEHWLRSAH